MLAIDTRYLLLALDGASLAMPALSNSLPVSRQVDHVSSVKHSKPEQVIELEASSVDCPVVTRLWVVEMIAFRREHGDVLHIAPSQPWTATIQCALFTLPLDVCVLAGRQFEYGPNGHTCTGL